MMGLFLLLILSAVKLLVKDLDLCLAACAAGLYFLLTTYAP